MKHGLFFLLYSLLSITATAQTSPGDITAIAEAELKKQKKSRHHKSSGEDTAVNVTFTQVFWQVDPAVRYIAGAVTHHFKVLENKDSVAFDLHNDHTVNAVRLDDQSVSFSRRDNKIFVKPAQRFEPGTAYRLFISYAGVPPQNGSGSFEVQTHNGVPILWTLSEPFGASDWWPCRSNLGDKVDSMDITIRVPKGNRAASNGLLLSVTGADPEHDDFFWRHRYPIVPYLVAIAVTNYVQFTDSVALSTGTLPVHNMVYPENEATARQEFRHVLRQLQIFDSLFIPYPFMAEKYGHAQFGWGGGMEHQTMSFMGNFSYELQSHELAHQWFGNTITCGSWHDIWLNEGFATYLSGLCYNIESPTMLWPAWKRNTISGIITEPGGSVYIPDISNEARIFDGRLSYRKGSMVLHMLRWVLGDSLFFTGVRNYLQASDLQHGFALTPDFRKIMENTSGKDLGEFFEDWVYGEGHPTYAVQWGSAGNVLNLKIFQVQSHPSVDFFEMPLALRAKGSGRDTTLRIDHTYNGENFLVDLGFNADTVLFDPDLWILSGQNRVYRRKIDLRGEITVFPAPATDQVSLRFLQTANQEKPVEVFDAVGRKVPVREKHRSSNLISLDVSEISRGIYFIAVEYQGERVSIPFIK